MPVKLSAKYAREPGILVEYMDYLVETRKISSETAYNYYTLLRSFSKYLKNIRANLDCAPDETVLHRVTTDDMLLLTQEEWESYVDYRCLKLHDKKQSFSLRISVIRGFYKWLAVITATEPKEFIMNARRPIPDEQKFTDITPRLEKEICDSLTGKNAARNICIVKMILRCGIGLKEICALKLDDVELDNICVTDSKGSVRRVPLDEETKHALETYMACRIPPTDGKNSLFVSEKKGMLKSASIDKMLRRATRSGNHIINGITVRDIQRTARKNLLQSGKTEEEIMSLTNVKSLNYIRRQMEN